MDQAVFKAPEVNSQETIRKSTAYRGAIDKKGACVDLMCKEDLWGVNRALKGATS